MENLSLLTPRERGAAAFVEGKTFSDNPYSPEAPAHEEWLDGYACEIEFIIDRFDATYGLPQGNA